MMESIEPSRRNKLTYQLSILFFTISIPFFAIFTIYFDIKYASSVLLFSLAFLISAVLNRKNHWKLSKITLISNGLLALIFYSITLNRDFGVLFIFVSFLFTPLVLFDENESNYKWGFVSLIISSFFIISAYFFHTNSSKSASEMLIFYLFTGSAFAMDLSIAISLHKTNKYYELELRKTNAELIQEKRILESTFAELQESLELNEHLFVSATYAAICKDLAHEFKNPLNMLQGAGAVLIRKYQSDPVLVDLGERLDATTSRLHRLTEKCSNMTVSHQ